MARQQRKLKVEAGELEWDFSKQAKKKSRKKTEKKTKAAK
jgi:hypothetical protein